MSDTSERRGSLKQNFYSTLARVSLLYSWSLVVSINAGRHIKNVPDRKELINLRDKLSPHSRICASCPMTYIVNRAKLVHRVFTNVLIYDGKFS